jgi:hypothetical protein
MNNYHFKIGDWIRFTGHISHQEHIGRITNIFDNSKTIAESPICELKSLDSLSSNHIVGVYVNIWSSQAIEKLPDDSELQNAVLMLWKLEL